MDQGLPDVVVVVVVVVVVDDDDDVGAGGGFLSFLAYYTMKSAVGIRDGTRMTRCVSLVRIPLNQ